MNGVIMVFSSIALTTAMSFATVLGRHRRIQRADPSLQKKQTSTETFRDLFISRRGKFSPEHTKGTLASATESPSTSYSSR
jgi:hypothetical protein